MGIARKLVAWCQLREGQRAEEVYLELWGLRQECKELTVFQVGRQPLPPGVQLRRYYMHRYVRFINQIQTVIDEDASTLARQLSAPEWGQLNVDTDSLGLELKD